MPFFSLGIRTQHSELYSSTDAAVAKNKLSFSPLNRSELQMRFMPLRAFQAWPFLSFRSCSVEFIHDPNIWNPQFPWGPCPCWLSGGLVICCRWSPQSAWSSWHSKTVQLDSSHTVSILVRSSYACITSLDSWLNWCMLLAKSRSMITTAGDHINLLGVIVNPSASSYPVIVQLSA